MKSVKAAIKALRKEISIPPIEENALKKCPTCGYELSTHLGDGYYQDHYQDYCPYCGQLLGWSGFY